MHDEPAMILVLNYLIAALSCSSGIFLFAKGAKYHNAAKFFCFFGAASLLGGVVHHIVQIGLDDWGVLIEYYNSRLPSFIIPLDHLKLVNRMWLATMICIGFAEYYFVYLIIEPIMKGKLVWYDYFMKLMLFLFVVCGVVFNQYFVVVAFHVLTHCVLIVFLGFMYRLHFKKSFIYLIILAVFNLSAGVVQQLMANKLLPTLGLHHNDWYHIWICMFVLLALYLLVRNKGIIVELDEIARVQQEQ